MQCFFPAKRIMSENELASVVRGNREIQPASTFPAKQLAQVIAHLESDISTNLKLVLVPASANTDDCILHQSRIFLPRAPSEPAGFVMAICLQYPVARGYVHIDSADPNKSPVIQPNYLSQEAGATVLGAGLRWIYKIGKAKHLNPSITSRTFPEPSVDLQDLKQATHDVHETVIGKYHICVSVAMGDDLDSRLRVKGVRGLRNAAASLPE